jgi:enoyl-CoA hydratase
MSTSILTEVRGRVGIIALNRPDALNTLTHDMCQAMFAQLTAWEQDDTITVVILRGHGDKSFCAGGDVVSIYHAGKAGSAAWENFFSDEYKLDYKIATYSKPIVSLCHGFTMGGGVGIGLHIKRRVAADNFVFAMPESGIGLIPDVGGTYLLSRLAGALGTYLGLTGERVKAGDALAIGLVDYHVPYTEFDNLIAEIIRAPENVDNSLKHFHQPVESGIITQHLKDIDTYFSTGGLQDILANLSMGNEWAISVRDKLMRLSPTSMKLTLEAVRRAKILTLKQCLAQEYRLVCNIKQGHDFYEGIRALLIDKDKRPIWKPAAFGDVSAEIVESYFAVPATGDWVPSNS